MANCVYCGQPAGFLRRYHRDCKDRHQHSISIMPGFFAKVVDNPMPAERFRELLNNAAQAAYVKPDELRALFVEGANSIFDSVLKDRPPTIAKVQRIAELLDALGRGYPDGLGLDEKLVKVSIISELYDGRIPEPVSVVGPMPIRFVRGEAVLWIFNQIKAYRTSDNKAAGGHQINFAAPIDQIYFGPGVLEHMQLRKRRLRGEFTGDLVLTNRHLYFLQGENAVTRIPIFRIVALHAYADAIHVVGKPADQRTRTFVLDDPWFAANTIARLIRLVRN